MSLSAIQIYLLYNSIVVDQESMTLFKLVESFILKLEDEKSIDSSLIL